MRRSDNIHGPVPVTIAELTAGLVWPTICRAAAMAAQPPRLLLGFLAIVVIRLLGLLFDALRGPVDLATPFSIEPVGVFAGMWGSLHAWVMGLFDHRVWLEGLGSPGGFAEGMALRTGELVVTWQAYLREHPIEFVVVILLVILPAWTVAGGAICRMIAVDLAGHYNMGVREGIGISLRRMKTGYASMLLPAILLVVMLLALIIGGRVLLAPAISIAGALLYGAFLFTGLIATLLALLATFTNPLMLPAVQVEGTDVLDAMQRAFAYLLGRPGRFLLYMLVAIITGVVAVSIAGLIIHGTWWLTQSAATAGFSAEHRGALFSPEGEGATHAVLSFWHAVLMAILDGYVLAFFFAASTALYLVLRRVNDDQDISEIWMPGMIEGTMAPEAPGAGDEAGVASGPAPGGDVGDDA